MTDRIIKDNNADLTGWMVDADPVELDRWSHELAELRYFIDADVAQWSFVNVMSCPDEGLYFTGVCSGDYPDDHRYIAKLPLRVMNMSLGYGQRKKFADKYNKFILNQRVSLSTMEKGWIEFSDAIQYGEQR